MSKLGVTKIKLFIPAASAAPTPPFGPILGQYGVNTVQFCKEYNEATAGLNLFFNESCQDLFGGFVLVVEIYVNEDRTYKYVLNKPPVSFLMRLLAGVRVGSPQIVAGVLSAEELVFMAQFKHTETVLSSACKMLLGTARSIGVKII